MFWPLWARPLSRAGEDADETPSKRKQTALSLKKYFVCWKWMQFSMTPKKKSSFKGPFDTISSKPDWLRRRNSGIGRRCRRDLEHPPGRRAEDWLGCFYSAAVLSLVQQYAGGWNSHYCTSTGFSCKGSKKAEECGFITCMDCMSEGCWVLTHGRDTYHKSLPKL